MRLSVVEIVFIAVVVLVIVFLTRVNRSWRHTTPEDSHPRVTTADGIVREGRGLYYYLKYAGIALIAGGALLLFAEVAAFRWAALASLRSLALIALGLLVFFFSRK